MEKGENKNPEWVNTISILSELNKKKGPEAPSIDKTNAPENTG